LIVDRLVIIKYIHLISSDSFPTALYSSHPSDLIRSRLADFINNIIKFSYLIRPVIELFFSCFLVHISSKILVVNNKLLPSTILLLCLLYTTQFKFNRINNYSPVKAIWAVCFWACFARIST